MTAVAEQAPPARRQRLESVDLLRGIAMIVMALDHVRDFFGDYSRNPTDPVATTSPSLDKFPFAQPPAWPLGLEWVYLVWWVVVLTVYPLCVWYAGIKARRRDWWLSYL